MSRSPIIQQVESLYQKPAPAQFNVGDTISIQTLVKEGDKERTQIFKGVVIAKNGEGLSETFTVMKMSFGVNVERVFLLHSPRLGGIEVVRPGKVRRAKLYYLRDRTGKSAKVKERFVGTKKVSVPVEASPEVENSDA